ncbi:hypothetical protein CSPX01_08201 [Colletotrichum filicis]|nr:hypothetical protein CSPX01_08201 [Colletotrichum filicis]
MEPVSLPLSYFLATLAIFAFLHFYKRPRGNVPVPSFNPNKTFRIRGVPLTWSGNDLELHLSELDPLSKPVVKSIAREIHGRSNTATVTFKIPPSQFQAHKLSRPPWYIQLPDVSVEGRRSLQSQSMMIDNDFEGMTTLHMPSSKGHKIDVVAIPGLGGHAFGSFKERGGSHMWLRDSLPFHLREAKDKTQIARVITWGYNSTLADSKSIQKIEDLAKKLRNSLLPLAGPPTRPIILIAHSMGGLIAKQALIDMFKSDNEQDSQIIRAVYGIAFFGVPHLGMKIESLIPIVKNGPNLPLLQSLDRLGSQIISVGEKEFPAALGGEGDSEIVYFYETHVSPTAQKDEVGNWEMTGRPELLVDQESATHRRRWEGGAQHTCPIARTHSNMVKFGPHDDEYDNVIERLKILARNSLVARDETLEIEREREKQWNKHNGAPRPHAIPSKSFSSLHEKDLDQDFPGRLLWYREPVGDNGYPLGTTIEPHIESQNSVKPIGETILTCRRIVNLQIRGHIKWIDPGRYRSRWVFWFFAGKNCPSSSQSVPPCWCPDGSPENTIRERYFPADLIEMGKPMPDSPWFYPWNLRCSAGRARSPNNFLGQFVDADITPRFPPQLLEDSYKEQVIGPGLWNTFRNTGWCEVPGPEVEVGSDGEAFLMVSKDFERKWIGGFSFGGVRLDPC